MAKQRQEGPSQIPSAPKVMADVYQYVIKEASPFKNELFEFWKEVAATKVGVLQANFGNKVLRLRDRHHEHFIKWLEIRKKAENLEELIKPDDPDHMQKISEYMKEPVIQQFVRDAESSITRIMHDVTEIVRGLQSEVDMKRAAFIAALSMVFAAVAVLISVFRS